MTLDDYSGNSLREQLSFDELYDLAASRLALLRKDHARTNTPTISYVKTALLNLVSVINAIASYNVSEYSDSASEIMEFKAEQKFAFELGLREAAKASP